jgi:hypothetical protein
MSIRVKLKKYIKNTYKKYDKNVKFINKLYDEWLKYDGKYNPTYPLVKYNINNDTVTIESKMTNKDSRLNEILSMIKKTLTWCKKHNHKIPSTTLYFWISDRIPWYKNMNNYPIYVFAEPINYNFPIFPDNTFECITLDQKYEGKCVDWDDVKILMKENCSENKNKEKIIYFKGAPTGGKSHNVRVKLQKVAGTLNIPLKILLDAWTQYEPIYKVCKYMYLLNLPGHYPWSNRFKYLLLTKSIVINIGVKNIDVDDKYFDDVYISFIDLIVDTTDYINITINYYDTTSKTKQSIEKAKKLNDEEFGKLKKELMNTYKKIIKNPKHYEKQAENTFNKVSKLTNRDVYYYIYNCMINNSKINFS